MYNELIEEKIADADPAVRSALAISMIQDMIAEIDYETIIDLANAAYWNTVQQGQYIILDRYAGEWMVEQSEQEMPYRYDPREGF